MRKAWIIALTALLLMGCQPTPTEDIVVNKGEDGMQKAILADAETVVQPDFPKSVEREYVLSDKATVVFAAEVTVPEAAAFPIYRVMLADIPEQAVDAIVKCATSDGYASIQSSQSKADALAMLEILEAAMAEIAADKTMGEQEKQDELAIVQGNIEYWAELYESAPDKPLPIESYDEVDNLGRISLFNADGATLGYISVCMDGDNPKSLGSMCIVETYGDFVKPLSFYPDKPTSKEEAVSFSEQFLRDCGIEGYSAIGVSENDWNYAVTLVRTYGGIPYLPTYGYGGAASYGGEYAAYAPDESISMVIFKSNGAIRGFTWYAYSQEESCLNPNVQLLDFEQILKTYENTIQSVTAWESPYEGVLSWKLVIESVQLGYKRIPVKDAMGSYIVTPAWEFNGYVEFTCDPAVFVEETLTDGVYRKPLISEGLVMVINAVDGTVISFGGE
ncbi:MAG: DUF6034 family protein [Clostridia bacterium]|nr:DUF6034 family protein [Clostridia bacterium]